jgi:hypothetical protein
MPKVGFEPMIPVLEQAKTVDAFYRAATVIGNAYYIWSNFWMTVND